MNLEVFALLALLAAAGGPPSAPVLFPDDPQLVDRDDLPVPQPEPRELSQMYDGIEHLFFTGKDGVPPPASNVNTLGEVPDSSWFTNRIGVRAMSVAEIHAGPDQTPGPDESAPWTVLRGKSQGITPGFVIRDARGLTWFIKVDPPRNPHLSSGAEIIGTHFFYAFGYSVPENHIATMRRDRLELAANATIKGEDGRKRAMTQADLDRLLGLAAVEPDGSIRVVASRAIEGTPLGPFEYWGTRPDDGNDIFRHEDRRELRGMRVFAAWLNHDDSRSINSLDVYVGDEGRGHVKHYLIDFSSTLGAGSFAPQSRRAGNEYLFESTPMIQSALTLGLWERPWRNVRYPDFPEIGRLEADFFTAARWKPEYPNPAFERMLPEDAGWAARILARVTDEMVTDVVRLGRYADPAAEEYLVATLLKRKRKCLETWLGAVNPIDRFRIEGASGEAVLVFDNPGLAAGLADAASYEVEWLRLDASAASPLPIGSPERLEAPRVPVPSDAAPFLKARLRTLAGGRPAWAQPVEVIVRRDPELRVVAVARPAATDRGR